MEAGDWANSMEFASFNRHAYDSVDDGPGDRVVADGAGQLHGFYSGVPALDSSKAAADDDLDLAVSKLVSAISTTCSRRAGNKIDSYAVVFFSRSCLVVALACLVGRVPRCRMGQWRAHRTSW